MKQESAPENGSREVQAWGQSHPSTIRQWIVLFVSFVLVCSIVLSGIGVHLAGPGSFGVGTVEAQETTNTSNGTATSSGGNGSEAAILFPNQTTNGQNVTVRSVTLPDGGFVGIHNDGYTAGISDTTLMTSSQYLSAGTHHNVTIPIDAGVPGGYANESQLNGTETLTARAYTDSNSNQRFEYLLSENDTGYENESGEVTDTSQVIVPGTRGSPGWTVPTASIDFRDQATGGKSVTIRRASLPNGGFLVVHDSTYLAPENDSFGSIIGVSDYIPANKNVSQVEVDLYNVPGRSMNQSRLRDNTTLVVDASLDTNDNREYDFYSSNGTNDTAYTSGSEIVTQRASITVENASGGSASAPSTVTETGQPVSIGPNPNQGIFGAISQTFQGPIFTLLVGGAFVLFVAVFAYQLRS